MSGPLSFHFNCTSLKIQLTGFRKYTVNSEIFERVYFRETSRVRSFAKIKPSRIGENTLSFSDVDNSVTSREIFTSQICLLTPFLKI